MQLADFYRRVEEQFGEELGNFYLNDTVLLELGARTANDAIEKGIEPKKVWYALCAEFDVDKSLWH